MNNTLMDELNIQPKQQKKSNNSNNNISVEQVGAIAAAVAEQFAKVNTAVNDVGANKATTAMLQINQKVQERALLQTKFAMRIADDLRHGRNCRMYAIPAIYHEYQPTVTVSLNGCTVSRKADGQAKLTHNIYIDMIEKRLRHLDKNINAMRGLPDIAEIRK